MRQQAVHLAPLTSDADPGAESGLDSEALDVDRAAHVGHPAQLGRRRGGGRGVGRHDGGALIWTLRRTTNE